MVWRKKEESFFILLIVIYRNYRLFKKRLTFKRKYPNCFLAINRHLTAFNTLFRVTIILFDSELEEQAP